MYILNVLNFSTTTTIHHGICNSSPALTFEILLCKKHRVLDLSLSCGLVRWETLFIYQLHAMLGV